MAEPRLLVSGDLVHVDAVDEALHAREKDHNLDTKRRKNRQKGGGRGTRGYRKKEKNRRRTKIVTKSKTQAYVRMLHI